MSFLTPHQSKALNVDRSISLTANAGSGKTFVLAQRFLEIIINTSTPLNQVAAITFTEKAAGELYKRISEELNKFLLISTDAKLKTSHRKNQKAAGFRKDFNYSFVLYRSSERNFLLKHQLTRTSFL